MSRPDESWVPMDAEHILRLGKLAEEASELAKIAIRCSIQGIHEVNPDTGRINIQDLEDEIADVRTLINLITEKYDLNLSYINSRKGRKEILYRHWLKL